MNSDQKHWIQSEIKKRLGEEILFLSFQHFVHCDITKAVMDVRIYMKRHTRLYSSMRSNCLLPPFDSPMCCLCQPADPFEDIFSRKLTPHWLCAGEGDWLKVNTRGLWLIHLFEFLTSLWWWWLFVSSSCPWLCFFLDLCLTVEFTDD